MNGACGLLLLLAMAVVCVTTCFCLLQFVAKARLLAGVDFWVVRDEADDQESGVGGLAARQSAIGGGGGGAAVDNGWTSLQVLHDLCLALGWKHNDAKDAVVLVVCRRALTSNK